MIERDKLAELETEIRDVTLALRTCVARVFDVNATLTDLIAEVNDKKRDTNDLVSTVAKTLYGSWLEWTYEEIARAAAFENLSSVEMAPFITSAKRVLRVLGYMK